MLYANVSDAGKIYTHVKKILTVEDATQYVIVNSLHLYKDCKLERLPRVKFAAEVNDVLSATSLVKEIGTWVFVEYEVMTWMFVRIGDAEVGRTRSADDILTILCQNGQALDYTGNYADRNI